MKVLKMGLLALGLTVAVSCAHKGHHGKDCHKASSCKDGQCKLDKKDCKKCCSKDKKKA